jgi:hypothetical protein
MRCHIRSLGLPLLGLVGSAMAALSQSADFDVTQAIHGAYGVIANPDIAFTGIYIFN